jgi:hypothetical protein
MINSVNDSDYKEEILLLFKKYLKISQQSDTNSEEDEMIRTLGLKNINLSDQDLKIISDLYLNLEISEEEIIQLLKN